MTNLEYVKRHHNVTEHAWRQLRKLEKRIHSYDEEMCNGTIQQDDSEAWFRMYPDEYGCPCVYGRKLRTQPADLLREAIAIAARFKLMIHHQSDPRGCALYVYDPAELGCRPVDSCYSTFGTAVC